jgi:hypothetical protein
MNGSSWNGAVFLELLLSYLLPAAGVVLVSIMGIILALLMFRRQQRSVALLTCGSLSLLLLTSLLRAVWFAYLNNRLFSHQMTIEEHNHQMGISGLGFNVSFTVGLALLLAAVFVGRRQPRTPLPLPTSAEIGQEGEDTIQMGLLQPSAEKGQHVRRAEDQFRP